MKIFLLSSIFLILLANSVWSQDLAKVEEDLLVFQTAMAEAPTDEERNAASDKLKALFVKTIKKGGAFDYPFENLIKVASIRSSDAFFRIFNWQIPYTDGQSGYECLVFFADGKKIIELSNKPGETEVSETKTLPTDGWYGCLYYDIQVTESKGQKYYTLLGWAAADGLTTRKYLECFDFSPSGTLQLGKPIFASGEKSVSRRVFIYSDEVSMTLRYLKPKESIVFDHLQPINQRLDGEFAFYGPGESFDAYRWNSKSARWDLSENIDMSRPKGYEEKPQFNFPARPEIDRSRDTINPLIGK